MVVITVTMPTEIGNRYRTEVRISRVTVQTSKSEAPLIKSSNVTLPSRGRRLRVATESPQRTFTSTPSIIFGLRMLLTKVISTVPRALLRPISKQRCRRRKGPRWSVRRALPQAIGSLIHPDLSCGAVSLPEDLTPRRLSSPCYGGLTVRIPLAPAESQRRTRAPTIAEETLSAHPVPRVVALLGLIGVSDDATAALDQTAVRRRNRPFANRRVRSKVAAGCSFQRIPSALLIGILRERGIGQCHRTHKRTRSRNPRRLYKASVGLSGNT